MAKLDEMVGGEEVMMTVKRSGGEYWEEWG